MARTLLFFTICLMTFIIFIENYVFAKENCYEWWYKFGLCKVVSEYSERKSGLDCKRFTPPKRCMDKENADADKGVYEGLKTGYDVLYFPKILPWWENQKYCYISGYKYNLCISLDAFEDIDCKSEKFTPPTECFYPDNTIVTKGQIAGMKAVDIVIGLHNLLNK